MTDSSYSPLKGIVGVAQYEVTNQGRNRGVKNGSFVFDANYSDSLNPTRLIKENWTGNYKENQKHNFWTYQRQIFDIELNDVIKKELSYSYQEQKIRLEAFYREDLPNGTWKYVEERIGKDGSVEVIVSASADMYAGKVNGDVLLTSNKSSVITGSMRGKAVNGLMDGDWTFVYRKDGEIVSEYRNYNQGILFAITKVAKRDTLERLVFDHSPSIQHYFSPDSTDSLVTNPTSSGFHQGFYLVNSPVSYVFSDGYPSISPKIEIQKEANAFFEVLSELFVQYDPKLIVENGLLVGANRGVYPVSQSEISRIKQFVEFESALQKKIEFLAKKFQDYPKQTRFFDRNLLDAWMNRQLETIGIVQNWKEILTGDQLKFYFREGNLVSYAKEIIGKDSLMVNDSLLIFNYQNQDSLSNFVEVIAENFQNRLVRADSLDSYFSNQVSKLRLEREISDLVANLNNERDRADSLLARPLKDKRLQVITDSLRSKKLSASFDNEYQKFLDVSGDRVRQKQIGDSLTIQMFTIEEIAMLSYRLDQKAQSLDSLYTEYVFDPFTFSENVKSRVKRTLYDVIMGEMFSDLAERALEAETPMQTLKQLSDLELVLNRLEYLRDKDTRRFSNTLKRTSGTEARIKRLTSIAL